MGARKSGLLIPRTHGTVDVPGTVHESYYVFADGSRYNQIALNVGQAVIYFDGYVGPDLECIAPPEPAEPLTQDKIREMMTGQLPVIPEFS